MLINFFPLLSSIVIFMGIFITVIHGIVACYDWGAGCYISMLELVLVNHDKSFWLLTKQRDVLMMFPSVETHELLGTFELSRICSHMFPGIVVGGL